VWVDALRERRAVIHNDYAGLPHRKGLPSDHPLIQRELVVPVLRNEQIVALLGVGNKPVDYESQDIDSVSRLANLAWDIVLAKRAEEALRESGERFRRVIADSPFPIMIHAEDGTVLQTSNSWCEITGYRHEELATIADWTERAYGERMEIVRADIDRLYGLDRRLDEGEYTIRTRSGAIRVWEFNSAPVGRLPDGRRMVISMAMDVTGRKRVEAEREVLQAQFAQAQKMESIGRLAGGVAHDFNNLLVGIMNYVELCRDRVGPDDPIRCYLDEITADARRSADLTRQLLAFARKQIIAPRLLDLNAAVASALKLLRRLIGEDIDLAWVPSPQLWAVKMDPTQLDQLLANLAVNARDAIGGVGRLTIETENATISQAYCAEHTDARPGDYVLLAVSDDGCGMDQETVTRLFEPFFTTKGAREGTGLGLATVYGVVTQNDGFISVYSEPGHGTTFRIYLPRCQGDVAAPTVSHEPTERPGGHETILLVEDEKSIRITATLFLHDLGYNVLTAGDPAEALRLAEAHVGTIHLLITDVIMPGLSGRDLATKLTEVRPQILCLFMSGYTADVIVHRGVLDEGVHFLGKPFSRDELARTVREVLDA